MFKNKTLLITGGTGSFGNAYVEDFLKQIKRKIAYFPVMKRSRMI
jgi:FlaA1/EpsC-like NDP-sugar epimerase